VTDQEQADALEAERAQIQKALSPMRERLSAIHDELRLVQERLVQKRIEDMGDSPDWKTIIKDLASDDRSSSALTRYAKKHLSKNFDMYYSGYSLETKEANIKLKVERTAESKAKNLAGLKFFASLLTPRKYERRVQFRLFEHTLSAGGIFALLATPDLSQLELICTTRGRDRSLKIFHSPEEAVEYIAKHHYFGGGDGEETKEKD
jgi:hypothetical protein